MDKKLPLIITFTVGVLMLLENYVKLPALTKASADLRNWSIIISAMALGLGTVNLFRVHGEKVQKRRSGWMASVLMFLGFLVFLALGLSQGSKSPTYTNLWNVVFVPMTTAVFSMKVLYMITAAYRGMVARRVEAGIILATAIIVMVAQVPVGELLFPAAPKVLNWIMQVPNSAGQRGLVTGAALGAFANAVRVLLGLERTHFGG